MKRKILYAVATLGSATAGGILVKKLWEEKYRQQEKVFSMSRRESDLLYSWLQLSQGGAKLSEYFSADEYSRVAVFGMNRMGRLLIDELGDLAVYGVEMENPNAVHERLTVYRLGDDPLPPAECIVICDLNRIQEKITIVQREFAGTILTLEQVLGWQEKER